jgi:hypothetical protein
MVKPNQNTPSVFTEAGEQWLNEMINALQENDYATSKQLGKHKSWKYGNYNDGKVPKNHPEFGSLIESSADPQYILIRMYETFDITELYTPGSDPRDTHPYYHNENFGKVRIYQEAKARGVDDFFAPITGWDGSDFHWITMPILENYQRSNGGTKKSKSIKNKLKKEDNNWVIADEEVGTYNNEKILADYGQCWYDGEWQVPESQLFDN